MYVTAKPLRTKDDVARVLLEVLQCGHAAEEESDKRLLHDFLEILRERGEHIKLVVTSLNSRLKYH